MTNKTIVITDDPPILHGIWHNLIRVGSYWIEWWINDEILIEWREEALEFSPNTELVEAEAEMIWLASGGTEWIPLKKLREDNLRNKVKGIYIHGNHS